LQVACGGLLDGTAQGARNQGLKASTSATSLSTCSAKAFACAPTTAALRLRCSGMHCALSAVRPSASTKFGCHLASVAQQAQAVAQRARSHLRRR